MRSSTITLTSVLIPALVLSSVLSGCGRDAEPAGVSTTAGSGAAPGERPDGAAPSFQPRPGETKPGSPASIFDQTRSATDIDRAREILIETGRVYREAPTLSDELTLSSDGVSPQAMRVRFDRNNERVEMALPTQAATYVDGRLFFTVDLMHDLYLEIEEVDDPAVAMAQHFNWVPPYHFAMRAGGDLDDAAATDFYLTGLGLGVLRDPQLRGYLHYTDGEGREFHRLTIDAPSGVGHVFIDVESMLITRIEMQVLPAPGQPAHMPPAQVRVEANPVIADELAEPIVFETGNRQRVADLQEMAVRTLSVGDRVPNYRFESADEEKIELADLRGYVVVVDFWATWCVPCIQGLPHLDRFARWAAEQNHPVKVFAVNTMEQHETFEERREAVEKFWSEREFTVPLVYDVKGVAAQRAGYTNIPLLFVIDPEGRITRVKDRFNRNMYQILKAETERALRGAGEAADPTK